MDAAEYARIADLLRQISLKIDKNCIPTTDSGSAWFTVVNHYLEALLHALDHAAFLDDRGHF